MSCWSSAATARLSVRRCADPTTCLQAGVSPESWQPAPPGRVHRRSMGRACAHTPVDGHSPMAAGYPRSPPDGDRRWPGGPSSRGAAHLFAAEVPPTSSRTYDQPPRLPRRPSTHGRHLLPRRACGLRVRPHLPGPDAQDTYPGHAIVGVGADADGDPIPGWWCRVVVPPTLWSVVDEPAVETRRADQMQRTNTARIPKEDADRTTTASEDRFRWPGLTMSIRSRRTTPLAPAALPTLES